MAVVCRTKSMLYYRKNIIEGLVRHRTFYNCKPIRFYCTTHDRDPLRVVGVQVDTTLQNKFKNKIPMLHWQQNLHETYEKQGTCYVYDVSSIYMGCIKEKNRDKRRFLA
ncbi:unnamed protein product [Amoebophrya sp. A25]|nr:unnamed protein product [Amoebophrya sp. A25]|eukprot:GSA25T00015991001.1